MLWNEMRRGLNYAESASHSEWDESSPSAGTLTKVRPGQQITRPSEWQWSSIRCWHYKTIKVQYKVWFRLAYVMPLNRIVLGERVGGWWARLFLGLASNNSGRSLKKMWSAQRSRSRHKQSNDDLGCCVYRIQKAKLVMNKEILATLHVMVKNPGAVTCADQFG